MGGSRKSAPGGRAGSGAGKGRQVHTSAIGASRGKRGAEGVGLGEGVSPSPMGGVWGGAVSPPQKIFEFLISNWRIFMDFKSITWQVNTTRCSVVPNKNTVYDSVSNLNLALNVALIVRESGTLSKYSLTHLLSECWMHSDFFNGDGSWDGVRARGAPQGR